MEKLWVSNKDILNSVENWVVSLSELTFAIKCKLNNTMLWDVPIQALPTIKKMKSPSTKIEDQRFQLVEEYINNTVHLRNNLEIDSLNESNWKKYLTVWGNDIFEIVEEKWTIYIAYHPIKKIYIVYKFLSEESDQNTILLWWLESIEKTNIEGYYKVTSQINMEDKNPWLILFRVSDRNSYYFIWNNWETQYFWDYNDVWTLKQYWGVVFFIWENYWYNKKIVIYDWTKIEKILAWYENFRKSKSGKNLLHVIYDYPWDNRTHSLFDLDSMEFIFEWVDKFNFEISFHENDVWTFEDKISWEFHESRKWLSKILWKKIIKEEVVL